MKNTVDTDLGDLSFLTKYKERNNSIISDDLGNIEFLHKNKAENLTVNDIKLSTPKHIEKEHYYDRAAHSLNKSIKKVNAFMKKTKLKKEKAQEKIEKNKVLMAVSCILGASIITVPIALLGTGSVLSSIGLLTTSIIIIPSIVGGIISNIKAAKKISGYNKQLAYLKEQKIELKKHLDEVYLAKVMDEFDKKKMAKIKEIETNTNSIITNLSPTLERVYTDKYVKNQDKYEPKHLGSKKEYVPKHLAIKPLKK